MLNALNSPAILKGLESSKALYDAYTCKKEYGIAGGDMYRGATRGELFDPPVSRYLNETRPAMSYPDNKKFAVCLTHDIDHVYPPLSHMAISSLRYIAKGDVRSFADFVLWKRKGREFSPYMNFKKIMGLEEKFGARSSFYFMATDRDITSVRYNIEDMADEMGYIVDHGWEVGLHGGYYAYNDPAGIGSEKKRLERVLRKKIIGYRNHYLMFDFPGTWEYLAMAGFKYDTTLGYNNVVGFRNGMCHPFRPFNLNTGKPIDIIEIPLAIMDGALFGHARHDVEKAWSITRRMIDTVERYHGVLTILWHNQYFWGDYLAIYEKILRYCQYKGAWITSGEGILDWIART